MSHALAISLETILNYTNTLEGFTSTEQIIHKLGHRFQMFGKATPLTSLGYTNLTVVEGQVLLSYPEECIICLDNENEDEIHVLHVDNVDDEHILTGMIVTKEFLKDFPRVTNYNMEHKHTDRAKQVFNARWLSYAGEPITYKPLKRIT